MSLFNLVNHDKERNIPERFRSSFYAVFAKMLSIVNKLWVYEYFNTIFR